MPTQPSRNEKVASPEESRGGMVLRQYWQSLLHGRIFPDENDIDPEKLAEIWDSCFLISIDDVTRRDGYRYSYLGKKLIEAYGDDIHNPDIVGRLLGTNGVEGIPLQDNIDHVISGKAPVIDEAEFVNRKQMNVKYRVSLFPLGRDGVITHILGCMRWRMY